MEPSLTPEPAPAPPVTVVSYDDVIESYRSQLAVAHHRIALLEAQVKNLTRTEAARRAEPPADEGETS